jgi:hypothetical protein
MKSNLILPLGLTASLTLMAVACQKPASQTDTGATASAASTASPSGGGVVSPPQPNGAINADANRTTADAAEASNSFTEGQAKGHIENAGFTDVTDLRKTKDGLWTAQAKKDGKSVGVTVDFKGAVTAN